MQNNYFSLSNSFHTLINFYSLLSLLIYIDDDSDQGHWTSMTNDPHQWVHFVPVPLCATFVPCLVIYTVTDTATFIFNQCSIFIFCNVPEIAYFTSMNMLIPWIEMKEIPFVDIFQNFFHTWAHISFNSLKLPLTSTYFKCH